MFFYTTCCSDVHLYVFALNFVALSQIGSLHGVCQLVDVIFMCVASVMCFWFKFEFRLICFLHAYWASFDVFHLYLFCEKKLNTFQYLYNIKLEFGGTLDNFYEKDD